MEQELNIIQNISNQTTLSVEQKRTFALNFKKIIRFGNNEEIKQAKNILDSFQSKENFENFYEFGLETYINISKSRIGYSELINAIQNYDNTNINKIIIIQNYKIITDNIILEKANEKLRQAIIKHPILAQIIQIKTPTKKQDTQPKNQEIINTFKKMRDFVFNKLNDYLKNGIYDMDVLNVYINQLNHLKQQANMYINDIGTELYNETLREIAEANQRINNISESMKEERIMWSK